MAIRILAVGDIHLGRRPSRLPSNLSEQGVAESELGPAAAWRRTVDAAIAERVDLVLLAGDVVESVEDRFEAYTHLEQGVRRLSESGIRVAGVVGNHDVEALPRLADRLPAFTLIGRGAEWERVRFEFERGALDVLGWSFPAQRFPRDPLEDLAPELRENSDCATLGLLHADLDHSSSVYAPVRRSLLESVPVAAWLLGHVHGPHELSGDQPIGYLGSLSGLDPGEPGLHGPRLIEIENRRVVRTRFVPVAGIRYERQAVDLTALSPAGAIADIEEELQTLILRAITELHQRIDEEEIPARAVQFVSTRIVLEGRSPHLRALRERTEFLERFTGSEGGVVYAVEKFVWRARPAIDLDRIALGDDAPARLARRLVGLRDRTPDAEEWITQARARVRELEDQPVRWRRLQELDDPLERTPVETLLETEGLRALEELLAQRAVQQAPPNEVTA